MIAQKIKKSGLRVLYFQQNFSENIKNSSTPEFTYNEEGCRKALISGSVISLAHLFIC
jgi:hypothetical protein